MTNEDLCPHCHLPRQGAHSCMHSMQAEIKRLHAELAAYVHETRNMIGGGEAMERLRRWREEFTPDRLRGEPGGSPERPFAWCRERVPVGYHIHVGAWPPPEPDDTAWQPLYLTPGGRPTSAEPEGRPVRPHRSGGQPVAPAFSDERLHRIDKLMDAQPGTPEGTELDKLVDEQVNAEKSGR